jgi:glycerate kinase
VVLLAGALGEGWETVLQAGVSAVLPLAERPSTLEEMERDAEGLVERAAERACRLMGALR